MPFKSKAQQRWMYATNPEMAKKWQKETPKNVNLPDKVSDEKKLKEAKREPTEKQLARYEKQCRMSRQATYGKRGAKLGAKLGAGLGLAAGIARASSARRELAKSGMKIDPSVFNHLLVSQAGKKLAKGTALGGLAGLAVGSAYGRFTKGKKKKKKLKEAVDGILRGEDVAALVSELLTNGEA